MPPAANRASASGRGDELRPRLVGQPAGQRVGADAGERERARGRRQNGVPQPRGARQQDRGAAGGGGRAALTEGDGAELAPPLVPAAGGRAQDPLAAPDLARSPPSVAGRAGRGSGGSGGAGRRLPRPGGTAAASRATVAEAVPYERSTPSRARSGAATAEEAGAAVRGRTAHPGADGLQQRAGEFADRRGLAPRLRPPPGSSYAAV